MVEEIPTVLFLPLAIVLWAAVLYLYRKPLKRWLGMKGGSDG
ncbi:hypothetical protein [Leucobacter chromiisoli]|nr:hypothetical protein [Leucobacter chromiisoli]